MKHLFTLCSLALSGLMMAQTPCEGGFADGYACENIDLLKHMSISDIGGGQNLNDNWGWTDPATGVEYAIIGRSNGTSFIDLSDPLNPVYLGDLPTHTTGILWRDVKVYNNHAFIVSEAGDHGMQVFDLTQLAAVVDPPVVFDETAHYDGFGSAHNIAICEESGFAYGVGTGTASGGLHIVNIQDPVNPVIAGTFSDDGYTHDAQIVMYNGPDADGAGKEVAFACNEDELTIVNCADKTDCFELGKTSYPGNVYAHQGWLTEDHKYFILDDEIDENSGVAPFTRTHVFDVQDLNNPEYVGFYEATTTSSDHNLYVMGDLVVASNYRSGVRILQIVNPAEADLFESAYFDTTPNESGPGYTGVWNTYPYFGSGVMVASDMFGGLFILQPDYDAIAALSVETTSPIAANGFSLAPNPANGDAQINFSGFHANETLNLRIVDATGREVLTQNVNPAFTNQHTLSLESYPAGMYVVWVEGMGSQRLLIQH